MKIIANNYTSRDLIKIIREWTELNQKNFGKTINKSMGAIKKYEDGERDYKFTTFMEICKTHNIKVILTKENRNRDKNRND